MTNVRMRAQSPADRCSVPPSECNATYQFTCKNKFCKPLFWVCDSVNDCGDNSDELQCSECLVLEGWGRGGVSACWASLQPQQGGGELVLSVRPCPQAARLRPSSVAMGSASHRTSSVTGQTTVEMGPMRPRVTEVRPGPAHLALGAFLLVGAAMSTLPFQVSKV